mmetsp:Transcript_23187/g.51411  ORF Transcript_23187/g.51411 Transcript_23187/m.51411 type:complete len:595 (-) Transcript_23187:110-1894(-)
MIFITRRSLVLLPVALICCCLSQLAPVVAIEGNTEICASPTSSDGNRAVACGADNPARPAYCCEGYVCRGQGSVTCIEAPDDVITTTTGSNNNNDENADDEKCASPSSPYGDRAIECGATNSDRPMKCCAGYECGTGNGFNCIEASEEQDQAREEVADNAEDVLESDGMAPQASTAEESVAEYAILQPPNADGLAPGNHEKCGGWRDRAVECGEPNLDRAALCCVGYKCHPEEGQTTCVAAESKFEPLKETDPFIQKNPIEVNKKITVVGSSFAAEGDSKTLKIGVPRKATRGDMLLLFIGGSAGQKRPEAPSQWELISSEGKSDLNIMSLYKWYESDDEGGSLSVSGGKNTFAIMSAVQGVDRKKPVVDAIAVRESAPGKDGRAVAPSAFSVDSGVVVAAFVFDDPQVAQPLTDGLDTLATSDTGNGDGMAAFVSSTDTTGYSKDVFVAGSPQSGGGNDVSMTVTLRPDGGPYDEPPEVVEDEDLPVTLEAPAEDGSTTASPTSASPTRYPTEVRVPTAIPTAEPVVVEEPKTESPTMSIPELMDPETDIDPDIAAAAVDASAADLDMRGSLALLCSILAGVCGMLGLLLAPS